VAAPNGDVIQRLPPFYQLDLRFDRRMIYDRFILNSTSSW
jgi:hypothetical protein